MSGPGWIRLRAMVVKELLAVLRDRRARLTLILPPILQLFLFSAAATLEVRNVNLGVYDRDQGVWSREIVNRLAGSSFVGHVVRIDSPGAIIDALNERRVIAVVSFEQGFSADVAAHRSAVVQALLDGRRSNASQIVAAYLGQVVASVGAGLAPERTAALGSSLVTNWFNPNLDYLWFTLPSLVVTIAALSVLSVTSQSVARERELGTFEQLLVSPLRVHEILAGKVAPALLLGFFNATVYLLLIPLVFKVPLTGSVPIFYVALFCYLIALIGAGLLVSTLAQTQQQAFLGMFLAVVPLILLSGFASPVDNMPGWLQTVAAADPLKHFLVISEGVFLKRMPAREVLANTVPLMLIATVTLTASALLFRSRLE